MIIEEIRNIKSDKSDWKKFGITMAIGLVITGFFLLWRRNNYYDYSFFLAAIFLVTGLIIPTALKPVYKVWMSLAVVMSFIITRVIITIAFYLIVTPIGLMASIIGKKFLDMKIDKSAKSYWIVKENVKKEKTDYERQF
jgi:hypothetical protein